MVTQRKVMIPGPTPVVKSIQDEMGREVAAFGDPLFVKDYKALIDRLGALVNCRGQAFALAGTGTLAMEMAIANTTKRGDDVLVVSHGFFGDRFIEICSRKGLNVDVCSAPWGETVSVEELDIALSKKRYAVVTVTHVDTATGTVAPVQKIGAIMKNHPDTLFIVDGVAATGGEYIDCDGWNVDILFTASQKAFGVCPGMFMLWASDRALKRYETLGTIPEYYVDFGKWIPIMLDPSKYFATPAINLVWALKEGVRLIEAEGGLMVRYERHLKHARAMQAAFEAMGFTLLAAPGCRAVTLSTLLYPKGVDDATFRAKLMEEGVVVAGGLGAYAGKMCRIGHMGNVDANDLSAVLCAVERALRACGADISPGTGIGVYLSML